MALGNSVLSTITEEKYPKIVSNVNLGLIEIYKRFTLKEKRIDLYEQTGITHYLIRSDYLSSTVAAVSSNGYLIEDSDDPFEDDIIKITEVI
ncbi:hypothetical protein HN803_00060, partial [candidate division WWE3 bacterium]|nr:hypothetical protein [candidate division WWE3 bacterium]